ncbi:MAG: DUF6615 family protein [Bacteroidota bacterium]
MGVEHYLPNHRPTVCDVFKAAAQDTWARVGFSRSTKGMKCHETALTQNLVYEMRLLKDKHNHLEYDLFESTNEKANGNDLLFRILHDNGTVYTYAIQAKIIYHTITTKKKLKLNDGWYIQLKHTVSKGKPHAEPQVDKLLRFSADKGYIPMYLLYNYVDKDYSGTINPSHGCTVAGAQFIKDNYTDPIDKDLRNDVKFTDLHTAFAFPWEDLVCTLPFYEKTGFLDKVGLPHDYTLKESDISELIPGKAWTNLTQTSKVQERLSPRGRVRGKNTELEGGGYDDDFNPKYLITLRQGRREEH